MQGRHVRSSCSLEAHNLSYSDFMIMDKTVLLAKENGVVSVS